MNNQNSKSFVSRYAVVMGDVHLSENVSVWPCAVIRADVAKIVVGKNTNIQDGSVLHPNHNSPVIIGENVTIGHNATVHGCTIGNNCLIGMGSILLDGCVIGDNCIVAAGALVPEGKVIESGSLVIGAPVKIFRGVTEAEIIKISRSAAEYIELAKKQLINE